MLACMTYNPMHNRCLSTSLLASHLLETNTRSCVCLDDHRVNYSSYSPLLGIMATMNRIVNLNFKYIVINLNFPTLLPKSIF